MQDNTLIIDDLKSTMLDFVKLLPLNYYTQDLLDIYELMFEKLEDMKRNLSE